MISREDFLNNLEAVRARIKSACEASRRSAESVKLMAVTKTHPAEAADWAVEAGLRHIGENRVQEASGKRPGCRLREGYWELIGPLQRNKARLALETVHRIQTVDRMKLATRLNQLCGEMGKESFPILLQVNTASDPAKHGCGIEEAASLAERVCRLEHLKLEGLMTIGELTDDEGRIRATFARLRELREKLRESTGLALPELSMGMTGDLELAIAEGSTLVRVGSALFGAREQGKASLPAP